MRPQIPVLALFLALALQPNPAAACSCMYTGPFSKVGPQGDLVVIADIVSHHENSMQVEVVRVLKGKESRQRLTIWGDNGMQCRPYVSYFPAKTRWVLSVFQQREEGASEDLRNLGQPLPVWAAKPPYYVISICGGYRLEVKGETAHGEINQGDRIQEVIPVSELVRWFEQGAQGELPIDQPTRDGR